MLSLSISTQRCTSTMLPLNNTEQELIRIVEQWAKDHGINATYVISKTKTERPEDPGFTVVKTRKFVFDTPKDEFKYRLLGGDRAVRRHIWKQMGRLRAVMAHEMADAICGVQPMQASVGEVFKLKVRYEQLDKR
jgi:hypothetical protein